MNCQLKLKPEILTELRQSDLMFRKRYPLLNILLALRAEVTSRTVKFQARLFELVKLLGPFLCNMLSRFNYEVGGDG